MPRMSLDMVVLRLRGAARTAPRDPGSPPHCWQLPALRIDETRDRDLDAARHRLLAQWGLEQCYSEQVCTLGNLERDPRGWSTTPRLSVPGGARGGAVRGCWHPLADLPGLDPPSITASWSPWGWSGCGSRAATAPYRCTCWGRVHPPEVQRAFEIVLQTPMNTAAFRKRIHRAEILVDTGRKRTGKQRPAIPLPAWRALLRDVRPGDERSGSMKDVCASPPHYEVLDQ